MCVYIYKYKVEKRKEKEKEKEIKEDRPIMLTCHVINYIGCPLDLCVDIHAKRQRTLGFGVH